VGFGQDLCDAVEELDKLLRGLGAEYRSNGQVDEFMPASNVECGTLTATDILDKASRDASQAGVNRICVCRHAFEIVDKVHAVVNQPPSAASTHCQPTNTVVSTLPCTGHLCCGEWR
jgi:hypothetical protein